MRKQVAASSADLALQSRQDSSDRCCSCDELGCTLPFSQSQFVQWCQSKSSAQLALVVKLYQSQPLLLEAEGAGLEQLPGWTAKQLEGKPGFTMASIAKKLLCEQPDPQGSICSREQGLYVTLGEDCFKFPHETHRHLHEINTLLQVIDKDRRQTPACMQTHPEGSSREQQVVVTQHQRLSLMFQRLLKNIEREIKSFRKSKHLGRERKKKSSKTHQKKVKSGLGAKNEGALEQSSNETNQTDMSEYRETSECLLAHDEDNRVSAQVEKAAEAINQEANLHFQNRVQAYERLQVMLGRLGISCQLFGSCCVGLAIRESDVDVVIPEQVARQCFPYTSCSGERASSLLTYLHSYLSSFKCVANLKLIPSASIPLVKFTIDNTTPMDCHQMRSCESSPLSSSMPVNFDLTVGSEEPGCRHLGIISTLQMRSWLSEISTLQPVCIILKKSLALRQLNQTYLGGVNTYTLITMLVAAYKKLDLCLSTDLSLVLHKISKFYSEQFNEATQTIDLRHPLIFHDKQGGVGESARQLEVRDLLGEGRVMTRNCYNYYRIKELFGAIYSWLLREEDRPASDTQTGKEAAGETGLLGVVYPD